MAKRPRPLRQPEGGALYVYCLVQSPRAPSLKGAPAGMPGGGPPRLLSVRPGIWAVVADAPLERFAGEQLQQELQDIEAVSRHALGHASMIEFFFRRAPVIPLRLFTLFSHEDRALAHLARRGTKLRALFARLRNLEEWGVRITASTSAPHETLGRPSSGRHYLEVRKRINAREAETPRTVKQEVGAALRQLGTLASRTRKEHYPPPGRGRPYVVGASFLVKAKRRAAWKKRVTRLAVSLGRHGHRLDVSGPWPPYHFASGG